MILKYSLLFLLLYTGAIYSQSNYESSGIIKFPMPVRQVTTDIDSITFLLLDELQLTVFLKEGKYDSSFLTNENRRIIKSNLNETSISKIEHKLIIEETFHKITITLDDDGSPAIIYTTILIGDEKLKHGWWYVYEKKIINRISHMDRGDNSGISVTFYDNKFERPLIVDWYEPEHFNILLGKQRRQGFFWDLFHK